MEVSYLSCRKWMLPLLLILPAAVYSAEIPAFPGAQGFGANTVHARGKSIFHVTRLDDEDQGQQVSRLQAGQFRWALAMAQRSGGGYILFDVAGTIRLKRKAEVPSNVYIAGQSAPGSGVAFEGAPIEIGDSETGVHDVVIRHVRHRGKLRPETDAFLIRGKQTKNVVLDHISVSFFRDGAVDIIGASDVNIQWSHFGDAVRSGTSETYHCEPHLLRSNVKSVTIHHNYYTHAHSRMPLLQSTAAPGAMVEFSANVIYNYRKYPTRLDAPDGRGNVIGNYYVPGPFSHSSSSERPRGVIIGKNDFTVFVRDNLAIDGTGHDDSGVASKGSDQDTLRGEVAKVTGSRPDDSYPETAVLWGEDEKALEGAIKTTDSRVEEIPRIDCLPARENINEVLTKFGALPRDNTDRRLVQEILTRTGEWKLQLPDDKNDYSGVMLPDVDRDGLPDAWERKHKRQLDPHGRDLDQMRDNIEVYLHERAETLVEEAVANPVRFEPLP